MARGEGKGPGFGGPMGGKKGPGGPPWMRGEGNGPGGPPFMRGEGKGPGAGFTPPFARGAGNPQPQQNRGGSGDIEARLDRIMQELQSIRNEVRRR